MNSQRNPLTGDQIRGIVGLVLAAMQFTLWIVSFFLSDGDVDRRMAIVKAICLFLLVITIFGSAILLVRKE